MYEIERAYRRVERQMLNALRATDPQQNIEADVETNYSFYRIDITLRLAGVVLPIKRTSMTVEAVTDMTDKALFDELSKLIEEEAGNLLKMQRVELPNWAKSFEHDWPKTGVNLPVMLDRAIERVKGFEPLIEIKYKVLTIDKIVIAAISDKRDHKAKTSKVTRQEIEGMGPEGLFYHLLGLCYQARVETIPAGGVSAILLSLQALQSTVRRLADLVEGLER